MNCAPTGVDLPRAMGDWMFQRVQGIVLVACFGFIFGSGPHARATEPTEPTEPKESSGTADADDSSTTSSDAEADDDTETEVRYVRQVIEIPIGAPAATPEAEDEAPVEDSAETQSAPDEAVEEPTEVGPPPVVLDPALVTLPVKKRSYAQYPSALESVYGEQSIRCEARVYVNKRGQAQRVIVHDCPAGFRVAAATEFSKWRWDVSDHEALPAAGLQVEATMAFRQDRRRYFPGLVWMPEPRDFTADPAAPVLLRSGAMPKFPDQLSTGDDVCAVELVVSKQGKTKDLVVDDCALPFRVAAKRAIKKWRWYPAQTEGELVESLFTTNVAFRMASSIMTEPPE